MGDCEGQMVIRCWLYFYHICGIFSSLVFRISIGKRKVGGYFAGFPRKILPTVSPPAVPKETSSINLESLQSRVELWIITWR